MLEYLLLLVALARTAMRRHSDVVTENVLLRQQLAVLTRPTRGAAAAPPARSAVGWQNLRRLHAARV
jgi:hypothetical protein